MSRNEARVFGIWDAISDCDELFASVEKLKEHYASNDDSACADLHNAMGHILNAKKALELAIFEAGK